MLRDQKSIGELIKYYRLIHGISQSELAELLHVTVSAVSNWERGLSRPSVEVAHILAKDMHMTLDEFFVTKSTSIQESQCSINEEIIINRLYFKLRDYQIFQDEKVIKMIYRVKGLSVTEASLNDQLQMYIYIRGVKINPTVFKITPSVSRHKKSSPELDEFPVRSHIFEIQCIFTYSHLDALDLHLEIDDDKVIIPISQEFNRLIIQGLSVHPDDLNQNQTLIERPEFICYLSYMVDKHGMKKIQEILHDQYKALSVKRND